MKKNQYGYKRKYAGMTAVQIRNDIRRDWMSYSVKFAAIQARAERIELPDGREKTLIRCACCDELFPRQDIEAHHINPVGRLESTDPKDVEAFMARMFVRKAEIQPLCIPCHRKATAQHRDKYQLQETNHALQTLPTNHAPQPRVG